MEEVKKKRRGIITNHCVFQGFVEGDPIQAGEYWFVNLMSRNITRDPNGQYVELDQMVQLMVEPTGPVGTLRFIKPGKNIQAWTSYRSWLDDEGIVNHAFVVKQFDLGE